MSVDGTHVSEPVKTKQAVIAWQMVSRHVLRFLQFHFTCSFLTMTMTLTPIEAAFNNSTEDPGQIAGNVSEVSENSTMLAPPINLTYAKPAVSTTGNKAVMERNVAEGSDIPRDSPTPLVIASSIAAVGILVFFVFAYLWHTHQLDSRARKLAIRLAADAEHGIRRQNCELPVARGYARAPVRPAVRAVSESSQEHNQYVAITPDDERGPGSDGGRSSVAVSESEAGDEDVFEPIQLPPLAERGRAGVRGGRGAHRKYSRSRKLPSGMSFDKRDSAVTDKEILSHFASRRHSTFFI